MNNVEREFLKELDTKLWKAADKLRSNMDAANYKHIVLGLIFLKYISDAFKERQEELRRLFTTKSEDMYYIPREDFESDQEYENEINSELEILEYYQEKNVFWVPPHSRWSFIQSSAALPRNTVLWSTTKVIDGKEKEVDIKLKSLSWLVDNALEEIETFKNPADGKIANKKLQKILSRISQYLLEDRILKGLIDEFSKTQFTNPEYNGETISLHSKDILGHVYEYFLGEFALAEGKAGGQYYTPKSIVSLIVEMLEPYQGRVYDPAMGSGGFFVSSDRFIEEHAKEKKYDPSEQKKHISVYGQESNPTTWKLAAMNMAIRGIDFNFGKKNADTFLEDQHPDLRADFVMANPPFNMKEWWEKSLEDDVRWSYGKPPENNANFAWMQHMLHHLAPTGQMALLLANGSMSSNTSNEGVIRKKLIEEDRIECMIALPGQLFTNTQIPACIWILTKDKSAKPNKRDRRGETLFIDARNEGYMKDRVLRDFKSEDITNISQTLHNWQKGENYNDIAGFCKSTKLEDMQKHDYVLTPGRYVGAPEQEEDTEPFPEKMSRLTKQLKEQFKESNRLEKEIKVNLKGLGYEL